MARIFRCGIAAACAVAVLMMTSRMTVAAEADFFKGKTVAVYVGYGPSGGYDTYARLAARHIGKHIPGNPTVVVRNRPGAGSLTLANELYNNLPKDGTAIGTFGNSLHLSELIGNPNIHFVSTRFNWIGRVTDGDSVFVVRPQTGVRSFSDLQNKQVIVGIPGGPSATTLLLTVANKVLGTKFKLISGYNSSADVTLAMERGEIDGAQSIIWSVHQNWIERNKMNVIYQVPSQRLSTLKDVPSLVEFAKSPDDKKLVSFFASFDTVGRALTAPPDMDRNRVVTLRTAFMDTMKDAALVAEVKKSNLRFEPMAGGDLQALINSAFDLSDDLKAKAREAAKIEKVEKRKGGEAKKEKKSS